MSKVSPELDLIVGFLGDCLPFDSLPESVRLRCAARIAIRYFPLGHRFNPDDGDGLFIVRSGAVDEVADDGIHQRLEQGESFLPERVSSEERAFRGFQTTEDTLIYRLPAEAFLELRNSHRHIDRFFHVRSERRLRRAARYRAQSGYLSQAVASAMSDHPLSLPDTSTIRAVAIAMSLRQVSSAMLYPGDGDASALSGIVTDRDLRSRAIAAGLNMDEPVAKIMSAEPLTVGLNDTLFDAVLKMTDRHVHHLPVVGAAGKLLGVLSTSDIHLARENDPLFFVQRLKRLSTIPELKRQMQRLPELFRQWVESNTPSHQITQFTTAVSDALTQRLIQLAIMELGPAPCEFCWLGFGSQARGEQLLGGDQDNGLLIADDVSEDQLAWFEALAQRVCGGLNTCGYDYCSGGVMATNIAWRKTLGQWRDTVDSWMRSPGPDQVMRVSIAFDLRAIYGDKTLCLSLQKTMLEHSQRNTIFLAALAENVLSNTPPLSVFGRLAVERSGAHTKELDMKKRGVLPVIELVRLHALAQGVIEVNTYQRLRRLAEVGAMTLLDSRNLEDAYTLINGTRLQQQAAQLASGQTPDNYLQPQELSRLQRHNLKQAFRVVHQAQDFVRLRYRAGV